MKNKTKRKIIIFGMSPFSKLMKYHIEHDSNDEVAAFTAEEKYCMQSKFCDTDVVPFEKLQDVFDMNEYGVLITAGYKNMNDIRKKAFEMCDRKGFAIADFIHSRAQIDVSAENIGRGNIILANAVIEPFAKIGDGNIVWTHSILEHENSVGNFNYFAPSVVTGGLCQIGNNNFFGLNATIRDSIQIGNYNLIGAGAYVSKNISNQTLVTPNHVQILETEKDRLNALMNR